MSAARDEGGAPCDDPARQAFRERARAFVAERIVPHHARWEVEGAAPRALWREAGAAGLLCCAVPTEDGGQGLDFAYSTIVIEELARVGATGVGFALHSDIVAPYLAAYAQDGPKRGWLAQMATGERIGALALTEPGTGSDLRAMRTRARPQGDGWVLHGSKTYISNGQNCGLVVVAARTGPVDGGGISLFVVEEGAPGFAKGRRLSKLGMRAQDTSELFFEGVRLPREHLLGEEGKGLGYLMHNLPQERLMIALRAATVVETALAQARTAAAAAMARPEGQSTRFQLAALGAEARMFRVYVDHCLALHLRGELSPAEAAGAKLLAAGLQDRVLDACLLICGEDGAAVERAGADARIGRIYGGSDEIMKEVLARAM